MHMEDYSQVKDPLIDAPGISDPANAALIIQMLSRPRLDGTHLRVQLNRERFKGLGRTPAMA
jgi:hypothetical protein